MKPSQYFPPVTEADEEGLLAGGGDLSPEILWDAYNHGIFPWFSEDQPILWWSPDPRMVLFPSELKISKSMKQLLKKDAFEITYNQSFSEVIANCATIKRSGERGTWITPEMQTAYVKLHKMGIAHSVEVWENGTLAGGLYGLYLEEKQVFCGESMFSKKTNASKYAFIKMVQNFEKQGVRLIDCQVYNNHLASLGAREISRNKFLEFLK